MAELFALGDRVTVRAAYPPGHIRTPYFARGCSGQIESLIGTFANPEELAYARDGLPTIPLYRVRFRQRDLWPNYAGATADSLTMDLYEHWLERIDEERT